MASLASDYGGPARRCLLACMSGIWEDGHEIILLVSQNRQQSFRRPGRGRPRFRLLVNHGICPAAGCDGSVVPFSRRATLAEPAGTAEAGGMAKVYVADSGAEEGMLQLLLSESRMA
jgi:hypothetical protein